MAVKAQEILDWYDHHARDMPWRVSPQDSKSGVKPDPYHVWLSEIMLQQTTVATVRDYFLKFLRNWPSVHDLAAADDDAVMAAWAGLGYYARARNLLRCARVISKTYKGVFPTDEAELLKLPGIGPYTAAAIASIAFDQPATVLDGNVERVMSRLFLVEEVLPKSKPTLRELAKSLTPDARAGDYAQAVMDLGATICKSRNPICGDCPWRTGCRAYAENRMEELPKKAAKKAKPVRFGTVYIAQIGSDVLVERRDEKGLLGGMYGWPGSAWQEETPITTPPFEADWVVLPETVIHVFTHFKLELTVATSCSNAPAERFDNFHCRDIDIVEAMPTVMRKAWKLAQKHQKQTETRNA